jgi:Dullard-like phosphatase family protein
MDLILNKNKSQRQQKQKVNLNFQKSSKNKIKKRIALFDLDETLVHCTGDINNKDGETYQHCIEISLPGNKETKVGINIRPHWKKTLNLIKKYYHIAIFTASHQAYADAVLDFMDPGKKYFKYRLYRNNCSLVDVDGTKFYVKDLDIFDEYYNLKDIVIIDNSVLSFIYHLENGIPIVPYYNEDKDGSLYIVGLYLMHIYKEDDLRVANKKYINLDSFLNEAQTRKETESTINEEPSDVETSNKKDTKVENKDEENDELKNNNNNTPLHKIMVNEYNNNTNSFTNTMYLHHTGDSTPQNRLIKNSRLFNVYYEFNPTNTRNNMEEIIEEKSNKSNSSDDEKIYNTNDNRFSNNNIKGWCFSKMMQTADYKPVENKKGYKTSKGFCISADLKKIKDTFDIKFSN